MQVNEPFHPGPVAIIADCPDEDYLPSLLASKIWQERFIGREDEPKSDQDKSVERKTVDCICHLANAEVNFVYPQ